ncbi:unnamed protein product [Darwinula stevensoni]|uniref:Myb-like domain-containing protein n=1 Tax=Darwinula stevensoni TaxID=69355 RepID=A0A7R8WXY1_9CRUS|nr:unnamed protein product [Darwinula stevensoni]CAG0878848.1 unnamed protein product [Darwinula stevensoni]
MVQSLQVEKVGHIRVRCARRIWNILVNRGRYRHRMLHNMGCGKRKWVLRPVSAPTAAAAASDDATTSTCPKCPIPTCSTPKWRVKRLRHFPTKWAESTKDAQDTIIKEFQIPHGVNRCCPACFHRLSRRLGSSQTENGGLDSESGTNGIPSWTDEEIETARVSLAQNGMDWSKMSAALDARKTPLQCRKFYSANKDKPELSAAVSAFKRRQADAGLVPPPSVTDEEESEESSCKAEGKKPTLKEEYDSSATASADEGHQMMEADDSLQKPLALSISSSISAESDAKSECVPVGEKTGATTTMMMQPKRLPDASPPPVSQSIRLKDVIEGTIDQTMTRPHSPRPPPVSSPTLSSILKPSPSSGTLFRPPGLEGLAKPQNEPPMSSAASSPGPAEDAIGEVQDLSVKKRGSPPPPRTIAKAPLVLRRPSPALPPTSEPPPAHCNSLQYSRPPESLELYPPPRNHSPRPFAPLRTPTPVPVKPIAKPALPPSAAPQLVVPSPVSKQPGKIPVRPVTGSITHGTPAVVVPPPPSPQSHKSPVGPILPMAPLSRQQRDVTGSICHGTPRSQQGQQPHPGEAKPPGGEGFYRRPSPSSAAVPVSSPYPAQYPPYPYTTQPQRPYTSDSQLSSRQIIMNDYITSQQMLSRREKESPRPESEHRERTGPAAAAAAVTMPLDPRYPIYYPGGVYVTSDGRYAQAATSTPVKENRVDWNARQGVIRGPQPYPAQIKGSESPRNAEVYQAGHERLAALVDVAVAQADRREEREREGLERGLAEYARRYHQLPAPSSTGRPPDMRQYSPHLPPGVKYHSIPPPPQPSAATPPPPDKYKLPYGGEQYERRLKQSESMDLRKVNSSPYMTGERRDLHYRMKSEEEMQRLPYPPGAYPPPHEMPRPGSKIPASGSDQLTAANLIDAIITHQINQGKSDPDRSTQEFFSKYAGKPGGPVGMPPPPRGMAPPPDHRIQSPAPRNERDPIHAREEEKARREHPSGITLQQHIDNIIQKDMTHPYYKEVPNSMMRSGLPPPPPQPSDVYAWKLQKALHNERNAAQPYAPDERQIIRIAQSSASSAGKPLYPPHSAYSPYMKAGTPYRVEPISPPLPDSNHVDVRNMPDRRPQYPAPEHPSPRPQIYDYVSNKIAEVMRTSEVSPEDKRFPMNPPGKGERRTPIPVSPHRNLIPSPARPGSRPPSDESRSSKRSLEENAGGSESEEMSRKKARPSPDPRQPDSPQSGEMVIDEGKLLSPHEDLKANSADPKMRPQYSMYRGGMPPSWYAYSALSVRPMANASSASSVGPPSSAPPPPIPPPPPPATSLGSRPREPTPIYSSQYEPLSDED